jgi:hypothetical protein
MIHSTRAYLEGHPGWVCALSIDCTNAFNARAKRQMQAAARSRFPELVAFTKLCYNQAPPLFFRMGRDHCELHSREGTRQGDPLG